MEVKKIERFKIVEMIIQIDKRLNVSLQNIPHKELELKRIIKSNIYNLLLNTYEANITVNKEKKLDLQEKSIAIIRLMDLLLYEIYDKKIISEKKYIKYAEDLDMLVKYYVGWINSTKIEMGIISKKEKK